MRLFCFLFLHYYSQHWTFDTNFNNFNNSLNLLLRQKSRYNIDIELITTIIVIILFQIQKTYSSLLNRSRPSRDGYLHEKESIAFSQILRIIFGRACAYSRGPRQPFPRSLPLRESSSNRAPLSRLPPLACKHPTNANDSLDTI